MPSRAVNALPSTQNNLDLVTVINRQSSNKIIFGPCLIEGCIFIYSIDCLIDLDIWR